MLFAASPEGPERISPPQLNRKAIPKNCSRVTESIFHKVCMGKRNSKIDLPTSSFARAKANKGLERVK